MLLVWVVGFRTNGRSARVGHSLIGIEFDHFGLACVTGAWMLHVVLLSETKELAGPPGRERWPGGAWRQDHHPAGG
jgi:hypothetical protein